MFNLVSLQSSARPGCLLELDSINDATAVSSTFLYFSLYSSTGVVLACLFMCDCCLGCYCACLLVLFFNINLTVY